MLQKYYKQKPRANADCKQSDETAEHISTCLILAKEQYIKRHDRLCIQLHFNIYREMGVK
jgi:hypothetical protein